MTIARYGEELPMPDRIHDLPGPAQVTLGNLRLDGQDAILDQQCYVVPPGEPAVEPTEKWQDVFTVSVIYCCQVASASCCAS
jgi:hypothetical protein